MFKRAAMMLKTLKGLPRSSYAGWGSIRPASAIERHPQARVSEKVRYRSGGCIITYPSNYLDFLDYPTGQHVNAVTSRVATMTNYRG